MYCDFCGSIKSDPNSACENCGTQPETASGEFSSTFSVASDDYGPVKRRGLPTWAIVSIGLSSGLVLAIALSFAGFFNSLNPFAGPVEDSELNVVTFAICAEQEGYIELGDRFAETFFEQSDSLDRADGFDGAVDALRSSGDAFISLGDEYSNFPDCGSVTFYENNQELGNSLNRLGSTLSDLPWDSSEVDEISRILSESEILLDRVESDLEVQEGWLSGFVNF